MEGLHRSISELKGPLQTLIAEHKKFKSLVAFQRNVNKKKKRLLEIGKQIESLRATIADSHLVSLLFNSKKSDLKRLEQEMVVLKEDIMSDKRKSEAHEIKAMKSRAINKEAEKRFIELHHGYIIKFDSFESFRQAYLNQMGRSSVQRRQNDFDNLRQMKIPKEVFLLISSHGTMRKMLPFIVPCTVKRNLATDMGTNKYVCTEKKLDVNDAVLDLKIKGKDLRKKLDLMLEEQRAILKQKGIDSYKLGERFIQSRHHRKSKVFTRGMFMFDREYQPSETRHRLILRDMGDSNFLYELEKKKTSLKDIVYLLYSVGVKYISFYDMSCGSEYDSYPRDYALFGGSV